MHYPSLLEDESLYSLVARLSIINDISPRQMEEKLSTNPRGWVADLQVNFGLFAQFTVGNYGKSEDIIRMFNTNGILLPEKLHNVNLIACSNVDRNIWRWCQDCSNEELQETGVAYWHRHCQRPCVMACTKHFIALSEVNLPFRERQRQFLLPTDAKNMPHGPACDGDQLELALAIAKIDQELSSRSIKLNQYILKVMFDKHRIEENALSSQVAKLKTSHRNLCQRSSIHQLLKNDNIPTHYLPALIHIMYGSIDFFLGQYYWAENMHADVHSILDREFKDIRSLHREVCQKFLMVNSPASRTDFWKAFPKSARWLSKYDAKWFTNYYPRNHGAFPKQLELL